MLNSTEALKSQFHSPFVPKLILIWFEITPLPLSCEWAPFKKYIELLTVLKILLATIYLHAISWTKRLIKYYPFTRFLRSSKKIVPLSIQKLSFWTWACKYEWQCIYSAVYAYGAEREAFIRIVFSYNDSHNESGRTGC